MTTKRPDGPAARSKSWPRIVAVAVAVVCALTSDAAAQLERADQAGFLKRAAFADGRLWLLSDGGVLTTIAEGESRRRQETLPEFGLDLCAQDSAPLVITGDRLHAGSWTLRRWSGGAWSVVSRVSTGGDLLVAMDCGAGGVTLLTTRRIVDLSRGAEHAVKLSDELRPSLLTTTLATPGQLFVGFDAGEWGGGLRRIDRVTGKITVLERNSTGDLCGGPLNTSCDPVNGIASEPGKSNCIVAAIGLVHFESHGRLVEVCGNQIERIYFKPFGAQPANQKLKEGDEPFRTVAFFGLTRAAGALWAAGIDGIYRFRPGSPPEVVPMPRFATIDGVGVSFAMPGVVLVLTEINRRASISGAVPMIVSR